MRSVTQRIPARTETNKMHRQNDGTDRQRARCIDRKMGQTKVDGEDVIHRQMDGRRDVDEETSRTGGWTDGQR